MNTISNKNYPIRFSSKYDISKIQNVISQYKYGKPLDLMSPWVKEEGDRLTIGNFCYQDREKKTGVCHELVNYASNALKAIGVKTRAVSCKGPYFDKQGSTHFAIVTDEAPVEQLFIDPSFNLVEEMQKLNPNNYFDIEPATPSREKSLKYTITDEQDSSQINATPLGFAKHILPDSIFSSDALIHLGIQNLGNRHYISKLFSQNNRNAPVVLFNYTDLPESPLKRYMDRLTNAIKNKS